jgi:hypothetical protein
MFCLGIPRVINLCCEHFAYGSLQPGVDLHPEVFVQNLGHALLRFRLNPPVTTLGAEVNQGSTH